MDDGLWGRRLCVYTEGRGKVNGKNDFFREKSQLSFWGMAGVSVRKFYSKSQPILGQDRGRGEAPLHFLVDSFGGGTAKAAFSGLLHRWEKVRKFAGHSAR